MKQAGIYVNDTFCGILTEDEEGYHFCYDKAYLARTNLLNLLSWDFGVNISSNRKVPNIRVCPNWKTSQ